METTQSVTQFHGTSPDELIKTFTNILKAQIKGLKDDLLPKQPHQYYTRQEVAKLFKVNLSTIHKWSKEGRLKSYGMGGRVYFLVEEVNNAIVELNKTNQ